MNSNPDQKQATPKSNFLQRLEDEIKLGVIMADDPQNANLPTLTLRTTTMYSAWNGEKCRQCHDGFRLGDRVRLCPTCGAAYHDDSQYNLHCWQKHFTGGQVCFIGEDDRFVEEGSGTPACSYTFSGQLPEDVETATAQPEDLEETSVPVGIVDQFLGGIEKFWRPFGEAHSIKAQPGSPLVGKTCPLCDKQIRLGDWVVACPCGKCGAYFHQDVTRHQTCWNAWNGKRGKTYCAVTGAPYQQTENG